MASLNKKTPSIYTHEGAKAARITPEQELRRCLMACLLWENSFYESGESIADRLITLAQQIDPQVVADMAVEARSQHQLRHAPLLLLVALFETEDVAGLSEAVEAVIQRPDELTELLSIYWRNGKKPLPTQMKKGLAAAFSKFNEYQLAKYNRPKAVKLRDVIRLCHPKPANKAQSALWKRLIENTMATPDTWEVALSGGANKEEAFTRLLEENKLGHMALLRNLRNMHQVGVSANLVKRRLTEGAAKSRALPFRYIAAASAVPQWEPMIEQAMINSVKNQKPLKGKTLLLLDHSGSMNAPLSAKSDLNRADAAAGLTILLANIAEDLECYAFSADSDKRGYYDYRGMFDLIAPVPPRKGMAMKDAYFNSMQMWGGTDLGGAIRVVDNGDYDRMIVITDEQSSTNVPVPKGLGYMINVSTEQNGVGYGKWIHIDGFSENVINWVQEYESLS